MQVEQTQEVQEDLKKHFSFEIVNTKSSRCREQMTRAKIAGANRKRSVHVAGLKIRPGRSLYLSPEKLKQHAEEVQHLEEIGRIVIRFDGKDISLRQAFALLEGEKPSTPPFPISYVNDPNPSDGPSSALLRMMHPKKPVLVEEITAVLEEVATSPTAVLELEPVGMTAAPDTPVSETTETPVEVVEEAAPEVDLGDLNFVVTAAREGMDEEATADEEAERIQRDKARSLTVKEASVLLGRPQKWVRKKLKDGIFTRDGNNPITIPEEQLTPFLLNVGESEE